MAISDLDLIDERIDSCQLKRQGLVVRIFLTVFVFFALSVTSTSALSKTLERECWGHALAYYEINGKRYRAGEAGGSNPRRGTGTSSGTVPSPVKARERACQDAAEKAARLLNEASIHIDICNQHPGSSGRVVFLGGVAESELVRKTHPGKKSVPFPYTCIQPPGPDCGDGQIEGIEECDDGVNNSDTEPNHCRTDCANPYCGDGVVDTGEACDEGPGNSDQIPDECRHNCVKAFCGDGVRDRWEECDDAQEPNACRQCKRCTEPVEGLEITQNTRLCAGDWQLKDNSANGVIRVTGDGVVLDCNGANVFARGTNTGTGIRVQGNGVIVRDCKLSGYQVGVKLEGSYGLLMANTLCDNYRDIQAVNTDNHGLDNSCRRIDNFSDADAEGCTTRCPDKQQPDLQKQSTQAGRAPMVQLSKPQAQTPQVTTGTTATTVAPASNIRPARATVPDQKSAVVGGPVMDLFDLAPRAAWQSGAGRLRLNDERAKGGGLVTMQASGQLASGVMAKKLLLVRPDTNPDGFVNGIYPAVRISANSRFRALASPMAAGNAQAVIFEVLVRDDRGTTLLLEQEVRGKRQVTLDGDLSRWRGTSVKIILRVRQSTGVLESSVAWVSPRVE